MRLSARPTFRNPPRLLPFPPFPPSPSSNPQEALRLAKVDAARWEEQAQQSVRAVSDVQTLREEAVKLEAQVAALEASREAGEAALVQARADVQVVARVRQEALR